MSFHSARLEEINYHEKFYKENELFKPGTWLARPVKTVMDQLELIFQENMKVLDLGCGVGRNSIPIAQRLKEFERVIL